MSNIPPPKGHASWLDYAIFTMDTRSALHEMQGLFDDDAPVNLHVTGDDLRAAARAELEALRQAAGADKPK